jgi:GNAT superfamily N-acetyltransferase
MNGLAHDIEMASQRAWPALQSQTFDGWELRCAAGFTKRANSVQPFRSSRLPLTEKIARCEAWYSERGAPTVFRMTPFADPELDVLLETRGYQIVDRTAVMHLRPPVVFEADGMPGLRAAELDDWLRSYAAMCELTGRSVAALRSILEACRGERFLGTLAHEGGGPLACGMAVSDGELVGLFDLVTDPPQRRQGYGTALIAGLLRWGVSRGAKDAYLQVVRANLPARTLYEGLGFDLCYDYWYRVRPSTP